MMTPLEKAQYDLVHEFPGGAAALATLAGMSGGTLSNKVNPGMESHRLALTEAVTLQAIADDYRILYAEAAALKHVCLPLADWSGISDIEVLNAYTKLNKELGEHAKAIHGALSDGRVTRKEFNRIDGELNDVVRALYELRTRLEGLIDE